MADYNKKTLFPAPCADIESSVSTSEASYIDKCECYIHSLKKDGQSVLAEATIIERIGDNQYLADYACTCGRGQNGRPRCP